MPRLGPKAFEQSAGFLRIRNGANPLGCQRGPSGKLSGCIGHGPGYALQRNGSHAAGRPQACIDINRYATEQIGIPTLKDIVSELARPGRDPRQEFETFAYAEDIATLSDLKPGMKIPGIVTNVTAFGAFVDIGVHQDGLVHISELADGFVKNPAQVVRVQQKVAVTVLDVDLERSRIALSLRTVPGRPASKPRPAPKAEKPRPPAASKKQKKTPFNNPFAELLSK